jgi:hypothetical protein
MTGEKKSIKVQPGGPAGYAGFHHLTYPPDRISESPIRNITLDDLVQAFPLSWTREGENPPVGLILCARKDNSVAHYALEGLPNKVLAAEYRTVLPDADKIAAELTKARLALEASRKGVREVQP